MAKFYFEQMRDHFELILKCSEKGIDDSDEDEAYKTAIKELREMFKGLPNPPSRYSCQLTVTDGNMEIAKFHQMRELKLFLNNFIPFKLDNSEYIDIKIEGRNGDFPK